MLTALSRPAPRGRVRSGISRETHDQRKTPGKNPLAVLTRESAAADLARPHGDGRAAGAAGVARQSPPRGSAVRNG